MQITERTRILVVAAHPDDEVLGCGGTIARALSLGAQVAVQFLGEGVSPRFPLGEYDSPEFERQSRIRLEGSKKALASLGVVDVTYGEHHGCQFDAVPMLTLTKEIEAAMSRFEPTVLFTHDRTEVNLDHRLTYHAVESACRPTQSWVPTSIYAFEIVCSGSWPFDATFKPNVYVDIGEHWDAKLKAWHCYEGESRPFPFPRSDEGLEALARYRGMASNLKLAEAFRLIRQVW